MAASTQNGSEARRAVLAFLGTIIAAGLIGWGSWLTTCALAHRERIITIEQRLSSIDKGQSEIKDALREIGGDIRYLREKR